MSDLLKTDLLGKVRNSPDFKSEALFPVFEAVVNSIHAIEEASPTSGGEVMVRIIRTPQIVFPGEHDLPKIGGFEIIDNGIGFNDDNYDSFQTSDSTYKLSKGCKGIGRFLWLKAFSIAEIDSVYSDGNGDYLRRAFSFSTKLGIMPHEVGGPNEPACRTSVKLTGFSKDYRDAPSAYKTTDKIAQRILEHCLAYYISDNAPHIVVVDEIESKKVDLSQLFEKIRENLVPEDLHIKGEVFRINHLRLFHTHANTHEIVYCANGRGVQPYSLKKALGTSMQFDDKDRKFFYAAYITSKYLDDRVDSYRQKFTIAESSEGLEFDSISMEELHAEVVRCAKAQLASVMQSVSIKKREMLDKHVAEENPMFRAVVKYCPEVLDEIELNSSNERISEVLYIYKGKAELEIRKRSKELLKTQALSVDEIDSEYKQVIERLDDFQKDELAAYVVRRKTIIDLLEKKLELNRGGKYYNEDIIHDIVFPRKAESDEINFENHNLWLIDEILEFHAFACSDKEYRSIASSPSRDRPDILVFAEVGEDKNAGAVSFVEFKKPQRKHHNEDPTEQLFDYLGQITDKGTFTLRNGRVVGVNSETRYYCYAICDLTDEIKRFALRQDYAKLQGEFGYYKYSRNLNAHTTIIDYNKLVVDTRRRHRAFFEKLGI